MKSKKPFHQTVAEKLIEQLKAGTAPWQKPWEPGEYSVAFPMNPNSGKEYRGINRIFLLMQGYSDPRWMTYKQAVAADAQVRKGEKGTPVQYWKFTEDVEKKDEQGKPVLNADGVPAKMTVQLERPRVFFATVFNAEQIEGLQPLQPLQPKTERTWDPSQRAEQILNSSGANIKHVAGNRAFYRPTTDSITLPEPGQFKTAERYYATALHELGHWTGHAARLDRDLSHPFGSEGYAKEELRAEIASLITGGALQLGHDPGQHAAYVGSWIKALNDDPLEIFRAAADAEKIHEFVMSFEQKQTLEQERSDDVQEKELVYTLGDSQGGGSKEFSNPYAAAAAFHEADPVGRPFVSVANEGTNAAKIIASTSRTVDEKGDERFGKSLSEGADQEFSKAYMAITKPRTYIAVPYKERNEAKELGAKWDREKQSWYVPGNSNISDFKQWPWLAEPAADKQTEQSKEERTYIAVPYKERTAAKELGAKWDASVKSWYVSSDTPRDSIAKWLPENIRSEETQLPAMTPTAEFKEALISLGCVVEGSHPIIDGNTHRITTDGDKRGEQSGFYVGHLDGHPAGYIKNNRTGEELKWKAKGYVLSPSEKATLQAEAAEKLKQREIDTSEAQSNAADRVTKQVEKLIVPSEPTAYMKEKGIGIHEGVYTDTDRIKTYVPAYDAQGKQWTMQYINDQGVKRFAKNSKKEGCFHVVGGMKALDQAQTLIIAEGYATAASIAETMKQPVVAAFDSGNLVPVAKALREKYPDKQIVVAGDDDKDQEMKKKKNPGKEKAEEAASLVNGVAVFPVFAPGEQSDNPKAFSDFNDLATKSKLGAVGVKRQLKAVIDSQKTVEQTKSNVVQLNQDKNNVPKKKAARI